MQKLKRLSLYFHRSEHCTRKKKNSSNVRKRDKAARGDTRSADPWSSTAVTAAMAGRGEQGDRCLRGHFSQCLQRGVSPATDHGRHVQCQQPPLPDRQSPSLGSRVSRRSASATSRSHLQHPVVLCWRARRAVVAAAVALFPEQAPSLPPIRVACRVAAR
jgi:hypothetical protein